MKRGSPYRFASSTLWLAFALLVSAVSLSSSLLAAQERENSYIPILVYHRFGPVVADTMTVTTPVFASHLRYLNDNGYTVIPLRRFVAYRLGQAPPPPPRSVIITVDDAHISVATEMFPLIQRYGFPVTLFVYPSAISHASYAMTWEQLKMLRDSGLFDIQSHSYWHPNFKQEKKRLSPVAYEQLVEMQLTKAKNTLEERLARSVDLLAWPFGIYDEFLMKKASAAGYIAAFTLDRRRATSADPLLALPRFLMTNGERGEAFARLLSEKADH
jgi:peptidoglycan/xylan/chitin deacetylase (PgdA/CDA1 family)